jgi:hypothetical protein
MQSANQPTDQPSADHSPTIRALDAQLGVLGVAVAQWAVRDDSNAQPEIRQAANVAVATVDDMLATLHRLRARLVTEIRTSDNASAARADALLRKCAK